MPTIFQQPASGPKVDDYPLSFDIRADYFRQTDNRVLTAFTIQTDNRV
jgi:hypothetical protein